MHCKILITARKLYMIQIKFLYFTCSNKFGFNPDKSALAYFSYRTGGSRNF